MACAGVSSPRACAASMRAYSAPLGDPNGASGVAVCARSARPAQRHARHVRMVSKHASKQLINFLRVVATEIRATRSRNCCDCICIAITWVCVRVVARVLIVVSQGQINPGVCACARSTAPRLKIARHILVRRFSGVIAQTLRDPLLNAVPIASLARLANAPEITFVDLHRASDSARLR
jgi:hypothetical protein